MGEAGPGATATLNLLLLHAPPPARHRPARTPARAASTPPARCVAAAAAPPAQNCARLHACAPGGVEGHQQAARDLQRRQLLVEVDGVGGAAGGGEAVPHAAVLAKLLQRGAGRQQWEV